MCCSVLQCVAVCCSVLQCVAVCCPGSREFPGRGESLCIFWAGVKSVTGENLRVSQGWESVTGLRLGTVFLSYGVATMGRLLKIIGLFCRISSVL